MKLEDAKIYEEGIVCYLDILGFKQLSSKEDNFERIKFVFESLKRFSDIFEKNVGFYKILKVSDSIFITFSKNDHNAALFDGVCDIVSLIREVVAENFSTDIRCGITFGKYLFTDEGEIFGPAVVRAVSLAEPKKENDELFVPLSGNPACIIIDKIILTSDLNSENELDSRFENENYFYKFDCGYFLLNHFSINYMFKKVTALDMKTILHKKKPLCARWRMLMCKNVNHIEKYRLSMLLLNEFEQSNLE